MKRIQFLVLSFFLINTGLVYSQDFPTKGEVYDYDIGDVFHRMDTYSWGFYTVDYYDSIFWNIEVIDKYFSINEDTVTYQYYIEKLELYGYEPQNNNYSEYYETNSITNLDQVQDGDEVIEGGEFYNGRKTVKENITYGAGTAQEIDRSYRWTVGCGHSYYYRHEWRWDTYFTDYLKKELVYFKKGDEEWGEEQVILGANEIQSNSELLFYPNPTKDKLNIYLPSSSLKANKIQIFNMAGELLLSKEMHSSKLQIDLSLLPNGLYFINQIDESGNIVTSAKFIKVE